MNWRRWLAVCSLGTALGLAAGDVPAGTDAEAASPSPVLHTTLKLSSLTEYRPESGADNSELLGRLRFDLAGQPATAWDWHLGYELRARYWNGDQDLASAALPAEAPAPFRLGQADLRLGHGDDWLARREFDRAYVALHPAWGEVSIGRQAIGLGRGVLFSAVDIFAPFSPLEIDREWRRGVDAARFDYKLSPTSSVGAVGACGESLEESAGLARWRGYLGETDAELLGGRRAGDTMLGGVLSTVLGDAETHGELALFHTPEPQPDGSPLPGDRLVLKAVGGASYTFALGRGLTVLGEYHYSGFGAVAPADYQARLADPEFRTRYLRGDTQILGRHALGLQWSYPFTNTWTGTCTTLASPVDGSGVLIPALRWDANAHCSVQGSVYLPWGRGADDTGTWQSEYGALPISVFLQLGLYF